jgi:hypothetical protein
VQIPVLALLPFGLVAFCLAGLVWLFILFKVEIRREALRSKGIARLMADRCAALQSSISRCQRDLDDLRASVTQAGQAATARPSLNRTHRTQVLRLSRRGDRPDQIAAALGVPRSEVELMLKIHRASVPAPAA